MATKFSNVAADLHLIDMNGGRILVVGTLGAFMYYVGMYLINLLIFFQS
jgi:hypothetical protein